MECSSNKASIMIKKLNYSDESLYEGQIKCGDIKEGIGKMTFKTKGYYTGEWKNDEICGFGSLFSSENALIYEGFWENGLFQGSGILYNIHQNKGEFVNNWVKYTGEFQKDLKEGIGKITMGNQRKIVALWKENEISEILLKF